MCGRVRGWLAERAERGVVADRNKGALGQHVIDYLRRVDVWGQTYTSFGYVIRISGSVETNVSCVEELRRSIAGHQVGR